MNWSRKQWIVTVALIFVAHVAAVFALHSRAPLLARLDSLPAKNAFPSQTNAAAKLPPELQDPLLFASANARGFSAGAWVKAPETKQGLARTQMAPRFFGYEREPASFPPMDPPAPRTPLPFVALSLERQAPKVSTMSIEGDLAARALSRMPALPPQVFGDVLSNTVVQVAVQADGFPFSARVVSGSGSRKADLEALELGKGLRFAPRLVAALDRRPAPLEWGQLVFQWFTTAPGGTNVASAAK